MRVSKYGFNVCAFLGWVSSLILALVFLSESGISCACRGNPPVCERISAVNVVFVGVAADKDAPEARPGNVIFSVEEAFKGLGADTKEIEVWPGTDTSCQTTYERGERYLMFGNQAGVSSIVASGGCSSSRRLMAPETISNIWAASRRMTGLQGFVKANTEEMGLPYSRTNGLAGVEILAVGQSDSYRAWSDSEGRFEIAGIPPGEYEVRPEKRGASPSTNAGARAAEAPPDWS